MTHRIELGVHEREELDRIVTVASMPLLGASVGMAGVGAAALMAATAAYFTLRKAYGWAEEVAEEFDGWVRKKSGGAGVKEAIVGRSKYEDADGQVFTNPFAGIPVVGSLFGSGINIGMAFNPFK